MYRVTLCTILQTKKHHRLSFRSRLASQLAVSILVSARAYNGQTSRSACFDRGALTRDRNRTCEYVVRHNESSLACPLSLILYRNDVIIAVTEHGYMKRQVGRGKGHYSKAVVANGMVFLSGILPIKHSSDGRSEKMTNASFEAQTMHVLERLKSFFRRIGICPS